MRNLFKSKSLTFFAIAAFIVGGFFVAANNAHAANTWNVNNVAYSDNTNCVASQQCNTIQAAVTAAASGDTINVAAGTYTEQINVGDQYDLTKWLIFKGSNTGISAGSHPGGRNSETIINGGFRLWGGSSVIDGFTIQGGFIMSGAAHSGIVVGSANGGSPNVTIENNIIKDCVGSQSNGIEVVAGSTNLQILNNEIVNNWRGIYINPTSGITISGNNIHANNGVGVGIGSSGLSNFTLTNNIIADHILEGWGTDNVGAIVVAHDNQFTNNTKSIAWYSGSTIDATNNWWGSASPSFDIIISGNVNHTPWYTDAGMATLVVSDLVLTVPTPINITKTSLVSITGGQSVVNAAVGTAITGLTPIQVTLRNVGGIASANVRISPINAGTHIQLWAEDTSNNWFDINVTGWMDSAGNSIPAGYTATTNVYAISDVAGTYNLTANLVDAVTPSTIITSAPGTVTVNVPASIPADRLPTLGTLTGVTLIPTLGKVTILNGLPTTVSSVSNPALFTELEAQHPGSGSDANSRYVGFMINPPVVEGYSWKSDSLKETTTGYEYNFGSENLGDPGTSVAGTELWQTVAVKSGDVYNREFRSPKDYEITWILQKTGSLDIAVTEVFTVEQIIDQTAPVITVTGTNPVTVAQGSTYTDEGATALDNVYGSFAATPSGSVDTSKVGTYTITYSATDAVGNVATTVTRTVNVTDQAAPVIKAPENITLEATGPTTSVDLGTPTVSDNSGQNITATNDAPANFPVGITTVTWTATDGNGLSSTATQTVTITDNTAPVISVTSDITAEATSEDGAVVTYTLSTASDLVDGTDIVTCLPVSDSTFALGTTIVNCSATDTAQNKASSSFTVTVKDKTAPVNHGGGNGGGVSFVAPCSEVTYGEWKTAVNGIQYRDIIKQAPNICAFTATQQSGRSRAVFLTNGTVKPETPANNNSTPTKQVLGVKVYADGTLLRGSDNKIYVVTNNTLSHITSLKELAKYVGKPILKTEDSVIASFAKTAVLGAKKYADGTLIKAKGDVKIYVIKAGKKVHIKSLAELKQYKGKTLTVEASELNNY